MKNNQSKSFLFFLLFICVRLLKGHLRQSFSFSAMDRRGGLGADEWHWLNPKFYAVSATAFDFRPSLGRRIRAASACSLEICALHSGVTSCLLRLDRRTRSMPLATIAYDGIHSSVRPAACVTSVRLLLCIARAEQDRRWCICKPAIAASGCIAFTILHLIYDDQSQSEPKAVVLELNFDTKSTTPIA